MTKAKKAKTKTPKKGKKYVYFFNEGNIKMKSLLGGKGAGLAEMTGIGLPVPQGFTITTEACIEYTKIGEKLLDRIEPQVMRGIEYTEKKAGKKFGDAENPLLLSVRSGAMFSMPGMMDTVLNLGLNDETINGLIKKTGNEVFAYDAYRRFVTMFGDIVLGIERKKFDGILDAYKERKGVKDAIELDAGTLKEIVVKFKELVKKETGKNFPAEPWEQLRLAIQAVFGSWNNPRAITYRNTYKISHDLGTAVNVQTMVFGNAGANSGTGVAFTRNPSTGEKEIYGEYLMNAQGEDVVAGIRTPKKVSAMKEELPGIYQQFVRTCKLLEKHFRDLQDLEFTIEEGTFYMLQCRNGKRTAQAGVKIAVDMVREGLIKKEEAVLRVDASQLGQLLHRRIDPSAKVSPIAKGLPASPGTATGKVIFDADTAEKAAAKGEKVILTRLETSPDDIHGLIASQGILTSRGGMTSHAAVVARGMGKPCVCGCESIKIDYDKKEFSVGNIVAKEGDVITVDGSAGDVMLGAVPTIEPQLSGEFQEILKWSDQFRRLGVYANADLPSDARKAMEFGAEGVGLCRTEHMFFAPDRLPIVQEMIMAETLEARKSALDKLLPIQRGDFKGILEAMKGFPVLIRLLDPPLHEFLPKAEELLVDITTLRITGKDEETLKKKEEVLRRVRALSEVNPMLGLRVCRLGIVYPEIYEMQVRAIVEATIELVRGGKKVNLNIMIPGVTHINEMKFTRESAEKIAEEVMKEKGVRIKYRIGTMIEIPRAAVTADEIAQYAEFFSFGTNDLTQTTFGFSRDDAEGKFIPQYLKKGILKDNPFAVLDRDGVGKLMKTCVALGRKARKGISIGICGEHGGDPSSIEFCHEVGLNYVSCSPFRVPVARLAAAQAALRGKVKESEQR
jgi:pyruvate,orthophosphate dikinase